MGCVREAPSLLLHVNILLMLFAGASLATGARLKWDPSTYIALRELFPREYRAAAVALPAAGLALLLLAHCAVTALQARRPAVRRVLLLLYAFLMALMLCGEVALAWWLGVRMTLWARSQEAEMQHAMKLREHLLPLLEQLSHWHPLPSKVKSLMQEAEADAPGNMYVALAAAVALVLLQALAVLLALLLAARARRPRRCAASEPLSKPTGSAKARPKVVYRNGRLVVCGAAATPHSA